MRNEIYMLREAHQNISDSVSNFSGKFLMYLGIALGSISYLNIKESLQFFCLIAGTIAVTLSVVLYILKIYHMRISIKIISQQLRDEIKKELNKKC